jgi:hypothetical protein
MPGTACPAGLGAVSFVDGVLIWVGFSIAMNAFPSTADARCIWASVWSPETPALARLIALPIVILIYLYSRHTVDGRRSECSGMPADR